MNVFICARLTLVGHVSSNSWALAKFIRVFITRSHAQSSLLRVSAHLDFCRDKKSPSQARAHSDSSCANLLHLPAPLVLSCCIDVREAQTWSHGWQS